MNELLNLLAQFLDCLELQMKIAQELLPVIDREEGMLLNFDVTEFEKVVVEKDQLVRRGQSAEERRQAVLKRICFMIAYDARGQLPTLRTFLVVFENYCKNVVALIDAPTREALAQHESALRDLAARYLETFKVVQPRIHRNQLVLKKMARNFERSVALLQSESHAPQNYDASGKSRSKPISKDGLSSVRVKA